MQRSIVNALELFAGAGGMALGLEEAGFRHAALIEWNKDACATLRANGWLCVCDQDVHDFDFKPFSGKLDLLAAGVPCQPFSLGGKHKADRDSRNMFPEVIRALREARPRAMLIENVRGLVREKFIPYFEYVLMRLSLPDLEPESGESWREHRTRLATHLRRDAMPTYDVDYRLINCADYGVPQIRYRVFVVGFRTDIAAEWHWPPPTHSRGSLELAKATDVYWREHGIWLRERSGGRYAAPCGLARWRTVRDALRGLPDPRTATAATIANHVFIPGARVYPGHSGSSLDLPAKALKAGDHGNPGGENVLVNDGSVRYFTVREAARIQTFSDEYFLAGTRSECMRQLGNAVPVQVANVLGKSIMRTLREARGTERLPTRTPKWMRAEQLSFA